MGVGRMITTQRAEQLLDDFGKCKHRDERNLLINSLVPKNVEFRTKIAVGPAKALQTSARAPGPADPPSPEPGPMARALAPP